MAIWLLIGLFIASIAINALLRPRIPRPAISPFEGPRIGEGENLPVLFGTAQLGPNIIWWGNTANPTFGDHDIYVSYRANMIAQLCHGPVDALIDIRFGDRSIRTAPSHTYEILSTPLPYVQNAGIFLDLFVLAPELYGGFQSQGGPVGRMHFHWGTTNDTVCELTKRVFGADKASAFPGRCYMTFGWLSDDVAAGGGLSEGSTGPQGQVLWRTLGLKHPLGTSDFVYASALMGEHSSPYGLFQFADNTPTPPDVAVVLFRYARGVTNAPIGADSNPADVLYEILTNPIWGLGQSASRLDVAGSFATAGATLAAEGLGISFVMGTDREAGEWIADILAVVDGVLYTDLRTGLLTFALNRNDYVVGSTPLIDASLSRKRTLERPAITATPAVLSGTYRRLRGFVARQQTDEVVTTNVVLDTTEYQLLGQRVAADYEIKQGATVLVKDTDYTIDPTAGVLRFLSGGTVTAGSTITATYFAFSPEPGFADATQQEQNVALAQALGQTLRHEVDLGLLTSDVVAKRVIRRMARKLWRRPRIVRAEVNRAAGLLHPGQVVRLDWPEASDETLVVRIASVSYGTLDSPWQEIEGIEDFADDSDFAGTPGSGVDTGGGTGVLPQCPRPQAIFPLTPSSIDLVLWPATFNVVFSVPPVYDYVLEIADDAVGTGAVEVAIDKSATSYHDAQTAGTTKFYRLKHTLPGYRDSDWIGPIQATAAAGTPGSGDFIAPTVSASQSDDGVTGTLELTVTDPQARVVSVAFASKAGTDAWTGLAVDTAPYEATVAFVAGHQSLIRYIVTYLGESGETLAIDQTVSWNSETATSGGTFITVADESATLPQSRHLTGESGVVSVTDGGAGSTVTVGLEDGGIPLAKLMTTGTADDTTFLRGDGVWTIVTAGGSGTIIRRSTFTFRLPHAEAGTWDRLPIPFATAIVSAEVQDEDGRAVTATVELEAATDAGFPTFTDLTGGHDVVLTADDRVIVDATDLDFTDWSPDLTAGTTLRARILSTDQTTEDLLVVVTTEDELMAQIAIPRLIVVPTTLRVVGESHRQVMASDATVVMSELQGRTTGMTATVEVWRAPAVAETSALDFGVAPIGTLTLDGSEADARSVDATASGFTSVAIVEGDTLEFRFIAASVAGDLDAWLTLRIGDASGVGGFGGTVAVGKIPVMVGAQTAAASALSDDGTNVTSAEPLILQGGLVRPVRTVSGDTTLTASDYLLIVTASATVNLPAAASHAGRAYEIVPTSGATATLDPNGAELIDGAATLALTAGALIASDGIGWHSVAKVSSGGGSAPDWLLKQPGALATSPNAADDHFEVGTALDTAGTRRAGATAWQKTNWGTTTEDIVDGILRIMPPSSGGANLRIAEQAVSGATWTYRARIAAGNITQTNFLNFGMCARESVGGKLITIHTVYATGFKTESNRYNSPTSYNSTVSDISLSDLYMGTSWRYYEIKYDGTNLRFGISSTGADGSFRYVRTETPAAFLGAVPTHVGVHFSVENSVAGQIAYCDWFKKVA